MLASAGNGIEETQQIIRHCSRFVFENQDVEQQVFAALLDVIDISCKQHGQGVHDPTFHLKSMYYIILAATKRKVCVVQRTISIVHVLFFLWLIFLLF